jgi:hypothetical protein
MGMADWGDAPFTCKMATWSTYDKCELLEESESDDETLPSLTVRLPAQSKRNTPGSAEIRAGRIRKAPTQYDATPSTEHSKMLREMMNANSPKATKPGSPKLLKRKLITKVSSPLAAPSSSQWAWAECDSCRKWRKLKAGMRGWDGAFTCNMVTWSEFFACSVPEEVVIESPVAAASTQRTGSAKKAKQPKPKKQKKAPPTFAPALTADVIDLADDEADGGGQFDSVFEDLMAVTFQATAPLAGSCNPKRKKLLLKRKSPPNSLGGTSNIWAPKPASQVHRTQSLGLTCTLGHPLLQTPFPSSFQACDECGKKVQDAVKLSVCEQCNYDVCWQCCLQMRMDKLAPSSGNGNGNGNGGGVGNASAGMGLGSAGSGSSHTSGHGHYHPQLRPQRLLPLLRQYLHCSSIYLGTSSWVNNEITPMTKKPTVSAAACERARRLCR